MKTRLRHQSASAGRGPAKIGRRPVAPILALLLLAAGVFAAQLGLRGSPKTAGPEPTPATPRFEEPSTTRAPAGATTQQDAGAAGMVAAIDPVTGLLTEPTPEQLRTLGVATGEASSGPAVGEVFVLPDGTVGATLDESAAIYSVGRIGPDSTLQKDCVQGREALDRSLDRPAGRPAAAPPDK